MKKQEGGGGFMDSQEIAAARWVSLHERELSAEEKKAFEVWLKEDPDNEACFFEQQVVWTSFDIMDEWKPSYTGPPNPDLFEKKSKLKRSALYAVMGFAAVLTLFFITSRFIPDTTQSDPVIVSNSYNALSNERHF